MSCIHLNFIEYSFVYGFAWLGTDIEHMMCLSHNTLHVVITEVHNKSVDLQLYKRFKLNIASGEKSNFVFGYIDC